jgi:hypothetical protein
MLLGKRVHHGWLVLFRFGPRVRLEEFRTIGLLYMNSSTYFRELEQRSPIIDRVRADRFEGSDWIFHPEQHSIRFNWPNIEFTVPSSDIAAHTSIELSAKICNVYCMYAMTEPEPIDEQNFEFGDSFVIVLNTLEFLRRFISAAKTSGLYYQYGLVEYYHLDKYSGETGPLRKPFHFAYQKEFRLVLRPGASVRRLLIGNLEDITSEVLPLQEINKRFDSSPEAARKAGLSW